MLAEGHGPVVKCSPPNQKDAAEGTHTRVRLVGSSLHSLTAPTSKDIER